MSIRFKLLAVFIGLGVVPLLVVSVVNYVSGVRAVDRMLRDDLNTDATRIARKVEKRLHTREASLMNLAGGRALREYVRDAGQPAAPRSNGTASVTDTPARGAASPLPESVRERIEPFFLSQRNYYKSIICLDADGQPLFRIDDDGATGEGATARFETRNISKSNLHVDERVWRATSPAPLLAGLTAETYGACAHFTLPVFFDEDTSNRRGALVVELKLNALFEEFDEGRAVLQTPPGEGDEARLSSASPAPSSARYVVALDRAEQIIYHTERERTTQTVDSVMPFFKPVAERMTAGAGGLQSFEKPDGSRGLAAFQPVGAMGLSVAVVENHTGALSDLRRIGLTGLALASLAAIAATLLLLLIIRHTAQRIENVAVAAAAVARGDLNQHIDTNATDETQGLAESFNLMTGRLREHITREAETRQFDSFIRISAMLTHDLKNAITGLSMLVQNFENHLHKEEFRADAIQSLHDATDKLRRIVARLTEPVKSLSGEYRRDARPTDLVPMIRRVLAVNAEPSVPLYEIEDSSARIARHRRRTGAHRKRRRESRAQRARSDGHARRAADGRRRARRSRTRLFQRRRHRRRDGAGLHQAAPVSRFRDD